MNARRVEVTFSQGMWDELEKARGHEPRASFVKRALEASLKEQALESALGGVEEFEDEASEHSPLDHSVSASSRAPVVEPDAFAAGEVMDPPVDRAAAFRAAAVRAGLAKGRKKS